jgi:phosphinothricin acetyltransferase
MLVITRQRDETVSIGKEIEVTVVDIREDKVRLGINAPRHMSVHRKEVYEAIMRENPAAATYSPSSEGFEQIRARRLATAQQANAGIQIRLATQADLTAINDIYNWYIPRSTCTYQEVDETMDDRRAWFEHHGGRYPVTVAERGDQVLGWGALSDYRGRSAYRFTCENSVYVRHDLHGRGIGSSLLSDLIERAKSIGFRSMIAGIDGAQTASVALHARFGFVECGRQRQVGFKFERWLDVVFMQMMLNPEP